MQSADAVVRLQALDGAWETCGSDRRVGVVPEDIQLQANEWGPDTASFTLKRIASALWPDLSAFTPVEVEIGGVVVWDGFITQTPTTEADGGSVSVQCKGWQYHLDDDSFEKIWTHSSLPDWKDARSCGNIDLSYFRASGTVTTENGAIVMGWSIGDNLANNTYLGVVFDAGPDSEIAAASFNYLVPTGTAMASGTGNLCVYMRAYDTIETVGSGGGYAATEWTGSYTSGSSQISFADINTGGTGGSGNLGGTFSSPGRYVMIALRWVGTSGALSGNDLMFQIKNATLTTDATKYLPSVGHNGANGVVDGTLASDVLSGALDYAPLLSTATTKVTPTSFKIPHFGSVTGGKTPREYITAANSYEDQVVKLAPGRVLTSIDRPTTPSIAAGAWGGTVFADASANSSDEVYNKVVVEGSGADGEPLRVDRYSSALASPSSYTVATSSVATPTTTSSVTGWTAAGGGTFTANTSGGLWQTLNIASTLSGSFASRFTFRAGVPYTLNYSFNQAAILYDYGLATPPYTGEIRMVYPSVRFGSISTSDYASVPISFSKAFQDCTIVWRPAADYNYNQVNFQFAMNGAAGPWPYSGISGYSYNFGTVRVDSTTSLGSLPDRRGFLRTKRLQSSAPLTVAAAQRIGDAYLTSHKAIPLKGSVTVQPGGIRDYNTSAAIHPSQLLLKTGELIHLSHRTDPDTGAHGRDGQVASVTYTHATQSADLAIDSQRNRFEALLERLAVVTNNRLNR